MKAEWKIPIEKAIDRSRGCSRWQDCLYRADSLTDFINNLLDEHKQDLMEAESQISDLESEVRMIDNDIRKLQEELSKKEDLVDFRELEREAGIYPPLNLEWYLHRDKVVTALSQIN
jgi:predicted  nucleic acid-binding Zn-ribbon protein